MHISEIVLETNSIKDLKKFYSEILDLEIKTSNEKSLIIQAGTTNLLFNDSHESGSDPFYHFAFDVPENHFQDAKEWIRTRVDLIELDGVDEFDFKSWNAHSIYFYDPAGNIVEFIARHNLKNQTSEMFSGNSLLCVSEIGLPVKETEEFYQLLKDKLHIPLFSGDLKNFTAAGDENGLFIIVPEGRKWFPDCPAAKIFPASVKIQSSVNKVIEYSSYKITSY